MHQAQHPAPPASPSLFLSPFLLRKVTLLEDSEAVIHLRNLSLHQANNEEEGGCGFQSGCGIIPNPPSCSSQLAVPGRHQQNDGGGKVSG